MKTTNIARHYETNHVKKNHSACSLKGQERINKAMKLLQNIQKQSAMMTKGVTEVERAVQAGYVKGSRKEK